MPLQLMDDPKNHGWLEDFSIQWVETPFPDDICELLVNQGENEGYMSLSDESDSNDGESSNDESE